MKTFQDYLTEATKISNAAYKEKMEDHSDMVDQKTKDMSKKQKIALLKANGRTSFNTGGEFEEPLEKTKDSIIDQMIWDGARKKGWKWA